MDDRAALNGILFVLHTGIPWEDLPKEVGFGSGMTCWRRLRDWQANGVWERLHLTRLKRLRERDQIDWSRVGVDGATVASIGRYEDIYTGVSLFANGYHLRAFCSRYPKEGAALRAAVAEFEAAYPDLVGHARQEPWFGMVEASVASSFDLMDDPDDFFHSAERCANSAATVHMLASDPQARALFLAWRFPRPAGTPAQ